MGFWLALWGCSSATDRITAGALQQALQTDPGAVLLVDVRTTMEFQRGHIEGAISKPYPGVLWDTESIAPGDAKTVVLICLSGHRSRHPLETFRKQHPTLEVVDLEGGMQSWWAEKLPTVP